MVRFVADSGLSPGDTPKPFFERPAVLVFASEDDLTAFGDVMEDSARLVIAPSRYPTDMWTLCAHVLLWMKATCHGL